MNRSVSQPPPVTRGDRIGVAALSGPVDPEALESGVDALRQLGFEPVLASNLLARHVLFAGTDEERLAGFHDLLSDVSIKGVIFARGGHGILRLLPRLDWDRIVRQPRAYVGYSDLTPLLNLLVARAGQVALHGPMVAVDLARGLEAREEESLLSALAGKRPEPMPVAATGEVREGVLIGGCLSLLNAVVGTSFEVRATGKLLFWEDVDEPLYRLDRMLTQLRLSGSLTGINGLIMGRIELRQDDGDEGLLAELLEQWGRDLSCPVGYGVDCGHGRPNLTLPLGLPARLDPERGELSFPD